MELDRAQGGVVVPGQQFLHQGSPGLVEVQATEAAPPLLPRHDLAVVALLPQLADQVAAGHRLNPRAVSTFWKIGVWAALVVP